VFWTNRGVRFLDVWSVRRRPTPVGAASGWSLVAERRKSAAVARFLQFQEHVAGLLGGGQDVPFLGQATLRSHFRWLPPVGLLPLAGSGAVSGFDVSVVTEGMASRESVFMDGSRLAALLEASFGHAPVDLGTGVADEEDREFVWTYVIRQNQLAIDSGTPPRPRLVLVFSTGHLPFQGDPQYDLARYGYSNYGLGVAEAPIGGG
jgi:hypothetical protein